MAQSPFPRTILSHTQAGGNGFSCLCLRSPQREQALVCIGRVALLARGRLRNRARQHVALVHGPSSHMSHRAEHASLEKPIAYLRGGSTQVLERKEQVCWCNTCVARHTCDARVLACFVCHFRYECIGASSRLVMGLPSRAFVAGLCFVDVSIRLVVNLARR